MDSWTLSSVTKQTIQHDVSNKKAEIILLKKKKKKPDGNLAKGTKISFSFSFPNFSYQPNRSYIADKHTK